MTPEKILLALRDKALRHLKGKVDGYALGGGTALSLIYFHHRESYDLDFFTKKFSPKDIERLMKEVAKGLNKKIRLIARQRASGKAQIILYELEGGLRVDFIEDIFRHFDARTVVDGIPVLSKESIYLRKIYAMCGIEEKLSKTGRMDVVGGRQESKDYFDLYVLSNTFMPLSRFVKRYCDASEKERIIIWYRRYDRMRMMHGLLDLRTHRALDAKVMDRHFHSEIQTMIEEGIS